MATSLYVGNLPFSTTDDGLMAHLSETRVSGVVTAKVAMKGQKSKGWAIIEFSSADFATSAMGLLQETQIEGRPLLVREDRGETAPTRKTPVNPPTASSSSAPPKEDQGPSTVLYVGNLPWEVTSEQLLTYFVPETVVKCEVQKRLSGRSKGFATVEFITIEAAGQALMNLQGTAIQDRAITVRYDQQPAQVVPSSKLFVGNLPWSVDDAALSAMFQSYNVLSAEVKVVNGRSRGFGIVEFVDVNESRRVLQESPEFDYDGRVVFCRFDRDPVA